MPQDYSLKDIVEIFGVIIGTWGLIFFGVFVLAISDYWKIIFAIIDTAIFMVVGFELALHIYRLKKNKTLEEVGKVALLVTAIEALASGYTFAYCYMFWGTIEASVFLVVGFCFLIDVVRRTYSLMTRQAKL